MNLIGENINDIQAEQSVLGAIFLDSNVLDDITFLEPRDFSNDKHKQIYEVMKYLHEQSMPVDIVTVTNEYNKFGQVQSMGGVNYLLQLADSCPTAANVGYYASIVRSKAIRRRGSQTALKIQELSYEDFESDEEYFAAVESLVTEMRPKDGGKMQSLSETKEKYLLHLRKKAEFILTGFAQFDEWSNGLGRGRLFVSAGRPSVGKTAKLLQRARGIVLRPEAGVVLIFSQEMAQEELIDRMISSATGVMFAKIKNKKLDNKEFEIVTRMYEKLEKLPIFIQDSAGITIEEVRATARRFKRKYGKLDMIAVDYLQIMKIPVKKGETRAQAIGSVTGAAKQIARDMNCCFMMLSQMTRESEQKKKPQLSDLKESSSIEQDADTVEFLWHDPNDTVREGKVIQQFIAKGRDTGINEFRLLFKGWRQLFEELPKRRSD